MATEPKPSVKRPAIIWRNIKTSLDRWRKASLWRVGRPDFKPQAEKAATAIWWLFSILLSAWEHKSRCSTATREGYRHFVALARNAPQRRRRRAGTPRRFAGIGLRWGVARLFSL